MASFLKSLNYDHSEFPSPGLPIMPREDSNFELITRFKTDYSPATITKYQSKKTGLSTVIINRPGPKVYGYFATATEIHDDSGAPHTLEHLIFMGSKHYQYKGVLDRLASRAYSDTNAWTDTDNTTYTLETAGWKGFGMILPVYIEHILLPTLTDAGCYTEVHHINGEGEDAGVVYSEMQGVQNTEGSLMELEAQRLLYPEGCGYRYETGGMMENLRVLTKERIREFHADMYNPRNLCLIVIGEVDEEELLTILDDWENGTGKEVAVPDGDTWKRPWVDSKQPPELSESVTKVVEFPEDDESSGSVEVHYLGPSCNDLQAMTALEVLKLYLAGSSISVLEAALVEVSDPICSSVSLHVIPRIVSKLSLALSSVDTDRLEEAAKKLIEVLEKVASEEIDMKYMTDCVKRLKRTTKREAENDPQYFSTLVVADHCYGSRDGSNLKKLETLQVFDQLLQWGDQDWRDFLRKWFVDNKRVTILGKPSAKLAEKNKADETERIKKQVESLGPKGLEKLAERLEEAKAENDKEIPDAVLKRFKIPSTDTIPFFRTKPGHGGLARRENDFPSDGNPSLPLYLSFESVPSNFITICIILTTSSIPQSLLPLLPVFEENFFNTSVVRDGKKIGFEEVVSQLEQSTVDYYISSYSLQENLKITMQVEKEKYSETIGWLRDLLWNSVFEPSRLAVRIKKLRAEVPEEKRDGNDMKGAVTGSIMYSRDSLANAKSTLTKSVLLKRMSRQLKEDPDSVVDRFEELRQSLCKLENMRVLVIGDIDDLEKPSTSWEAFTQGRDAPKSIASLDRRCKRLSDLGKAPKKKAFIVPMPTIDSSFSMHITQGPAHVDDPSLPALILAISYLVAVEGPVWRSVRGAGLAYGAGFRHDRDSGHIAFTIYRSPDASKAFLAGRKVITDHLDGTTPFDKLALEGARSAVAVDIADREATMTAAAEQSFLNFEAWGKKQGWTKELLHAVEKVTVDEVKDVFQNLLLKCFDPEHSVSVITSAVVKADDIKEAFATEGYETEIRELDSFADDYGLWREYAGGGSNEGDSESEEDDEEGFVEVGADEEDSDDEVEFTPDEDD